MVNSDAELPPWKMASKLALGAMVQFGFSKPMCCVCMLVL